VKIRAFKAFKSFDRFACSTGLAFVQRVSSFVFEPRFEQIERFEQFER